MISIIFIIIASAYAGGDQTTELQPELETMLNDLYQISQDLAHLGHNDTCQTPNGRRAQIGLAASLRDDRKQSSFENSSLNAREVLEASALQGNGKAALEIAQEYENDQSKKVNIDKARHYYSVAAENGIPEAYLPLGKMLLEGRGGPKDLDGALKYFRQVIDPDIPPLLHRVRHERSLAVEKLLETAPFLKGTKLGGDTEKKAGMMETYFVQLGHNQRGYFKPANQKNHLGKELGWGNDYQHEISAYHLDRLLDFDLVPVTVKRIFNINGIKIMGSFQMHHEGGEADTVKTESKIKYHKSSRLQLLDYLLGNCDRHDRNYLIKRGDGNIDDVESAIDNGVAFNSRYCDRIFQDFQKGKRGSDQLVQIPFDPPEDILEKLENIPDSEYRAKLPLLSETELSGFIGRKNCASLWYAAKIGNIAKAKERVLTCPPDPIWNNSLLHRAVDGGKIAVLETLIAGGADVNHRARTGHTPLTLAILKGDNHAVKTLLAGNAQVNLVGPQGRTPLSIAAEQGHLETLRTLIAAGARIDIPDDGGRTPLAYAKDKGYPLVVQELLKTGTRLGQNPNGLQRRRRKTL